MRLRSWVWRSQTTDGSVGFDDSVITAGNNFIDPQYPARGPGDFRACRDLIAQTDHDSRIAARKIAGTARHEIVLVSSEVVGHSHPGTDRIPIGLSAYQLKSDPMFLVTDQILEQKRTVPEILHQNIDVAVVIEIAEGCASRRQFLTKDRPERIAHIHKSAALVFQQQRRLQVRNRAG